MAKDQGRAGQHRTAGQQGTAGHESTVAVDIAAPVQDVWAVLTALDHAENILSGVTAIEKLTPGPYAPGTRWNETRRMLGRTETMQLAVETVDEPRSTVVTSEQSGVTYTTTFTLAPRGAGTRLSMRFAAEHAQPSGAARALWNTLGEVGVRVTSRVMRRDLTDIGAAAVGHFLARSTRDGPGQPSS